MYISNGKDFYGDYGNRILHRMCQEKLKHIDVDAVHSKLWLIRRAYAAAIETSKNLLGGDFHMAKMIEIG